MSLMFQLCLRKWLEIHPSSEFRCFVHDHQLIGQQKKSWLIHDKILWLSYHNYILAGICQRQHCAYYRHLADNREKIRNEIMSFFWKKIAKKFPSISCESRQLIASFCSPHGSYIRGKLGHFERDCGSKSLSAYNSLGNSH